GEPLAPDLVGREDLRQVALLLLLGAVGDDRRAGHAEANHVHVLRRLGARDLLEQDRLVRVGRAAAAVFLGPGQSRVTLVGELLAPAVPGRLVLGLAAARPGHLGRDVLLEPAAHLGAECGLFRDIAEIHRAYSTERSALR